MHEDAHSTHDIEVPTDRNFGLTVGGIVGLIECYRWWSSGIVDTLGIVLLCIAGPLLFFGVVYPPVLAPLNKAWGALGLFLFRFVNPIIMFVKYVLTIIPTAMVLRLLGKDPLRLKLDASAQSYWIERDPKGPSPESMKNQF